MERNDSRNTRVQYLYRDASNYKQWEEVVLAGAVEESALRETLMEGLFFLPTAVGLPDLSLRFGEQGYEFPTTDDHPWHEFAGLETTAASPTHALTAAEFLENLRRSQQCGGVFPLGRTFTWPFPV